MARAIDSKTYYMVMEKVDALDRDRLLDLASEVVSELVNNRHSNNDERIDGILEAMELVLATKIR
jgi:hypothetical protein